MQLSPAECDLFYKLHSGLMCYANEKLEILPGEGATPEQYAALSPEKRFEVRNALHDRPSLIDQFAEENPHGFSPEELEVVRGWRHALVGSFYIFRYLKHYAVFLHSEQEELKAYGVLALFDLFEEMLGPHLPQLVQTVLLPFQGKIVYDGILSGYPIFFGGGIKRHMNEDYKLAKARWGIITSLPSGKEEPEPAEETKAVMTTHDRGGKSHETWIGGKTTLPLPLTQAQRRTVAGLFPQFEPRLLLDAVNKRTLRFTLEEVKKIARTCKVAIPKAASKVESNSLGYVVDAAQQALSRFKQEGMERIPKSRRLYQFKITLVGTDPPIWRRIQVKDGSLDKLHEHIQTSMGWTNSHLHQFTIGRVRHGDPRMLLEGFEDDPELVDSREIRLSQIVPESGKRFRFEYEYDFGDGWEHDVLFEGRVEAEKGVRYPLCVEGERACPPEDVGGIWGYQDFLEAMADPRHDEHEPYMEWHGPFDPEAFDARATTNHMRRGVLKW